MAQYKSKRSKACDIPLTVKQVVAERDKGHCLVCGRQGSSNAHYIPRSQGGLGIEQNIVTLCPSCHNDYDNGFKRKEIRQILKDYLSSKYKDWDEKKLIYRKGTI